MLTNSDDTAMRVFQLPRDWDYSSDQTYVSCIFDGVCEALDHC